MSQLVPSGSFRRQIVVLTACVTAFAMVMLTVVVQLVLAAQTKRDVDRVLEDRADAVAGSTTSSKQGALAVPDTELDRGVVVYDADGTLAAGLVPGELADTYADLSTTTVTQVRNVGDDRRVLALPFTTSTGTQGVVIVDELLGPYEEAEFYALIVSLTTGAIATAAAAALAAWVTKRALRPVAVLATTAADWSEHDLSRRFALGPPTNELTALAGTLDTLLDRVTAAIRSEQRLTSELAHELRTPLTTIQGTADLALMGEHLSPSTREDLTAISGAAHRMTSTIATLLELARTERNVADSAVSSLTAVVDEVVRSTPTDLSVNVDVPDLRLGMPHALAVRTLAPVMANAARFATSAIRIHVDPTATSVDLVVEDDGPGVQGDSDRIFEAGTTTGGGSGAGLGLSLARRVARSYGGDVELTRTGDPTQFTVRLPSV